MTEQQQHDAIIELAKLLLLKHKNIDYDAIVDNHKEYTETKEYVKDQVIEALRELCREHGKIDALLICSRLLRIQHINEVKPEEYNICDNAAKAMNILLELEKLEDDAMMVQSCVQHHKEQLEFHKGQLEDEEKALKDIEDKIAALKGEG